ncbi:TSCPD domain-containing protein [Geomonas sp. RF6]|uniref:TSCPD domain-containing protein n=1 Tax=Geomonas sp. RF6 TaxID=2897342 RepID=UPI001E4977F1|nr:TSCPD domain-containing protein [Geomonas sp. RF6]UFS70352.1 TSCPD domain-containing protein [Geomonas sp. RF6]
MTSVKIRRPQALPGRTFEMHTHCGKLYLTVNRDPQTGQVMEVFARFGKSGGCGAAIMDGLTRVISYALRSGMEPKQAVKALTGIQCHMGPQTCLNAVAKAIQDALDE